MNEIIDVPGAVILLCVALSTSVLINSACRVIRTLAGLPRQRRQPARSPDNQPQLIPVSTIPGKQELLVDDLERYRRQNFSVPIQTRHRPAETWPILKRRAPTQHQAKQTNERKKG